MPDNETINRHIHEMLGKCWHEPKSVPHSLFGAKFICVNCEKPLIYYDGTRFAQDRMNPDYCSDESPRRLLNEAVDKAVEMVGEETFTKHVVVEALDPHPTPQDVGLFIELGGPSWVFSSLVTRASAQQIATAIYHATKEEGK